MEEITKVKSHFPSFDVGICITTSIEADQFKSLMKIKADGFCIAGLGLKGNGAAALFFCNLFRLIHKAFPKPLALKFICDPEFGHHQSVGPFLGANFYAGKQLSVIANNSISLRILSVILV